jgi:hypothetical protein
MVARGLAWYHWRLYLEPGYEVQTHTVTARGLRHYEEKLFCKNVRARVSNNLGNDTFIYEGVQASEYDCSNRCESGWMSDHTPRTRMALPLKDSWL